MSIPKLNNSKENEIRVKEILNNRPLQIIALELTNVILFLFAYNFKAYIRMDIINEIIAPLIVAVLTGSAGWLYGNLKARKKAANKIEAAPREYVKALDRLIEKALLEGVDNAITNARAIVSARNSLRSSLVSLSKQLNSEIDRLARDIGERNEQPAEPSFSVSETGYIDPERAYTTISVLSKIWPAKRLQVEVEIRKLITELGLDSNY